MPRRNSTGMSMQSQSRRTARPEIQRNFSCLRTTRYNYGAVLVMEPAHHITHLYLAQRVYFTW